MTSDPLAKLTAEVGRLAAEVAAMREQMARYGESVEAFKALTLPVEVIYRAGQDDKRAAFADYRPPRHKPRNGQRPGHLQAVTT